MILGITLRHALALSTLLLSISCVLGDEGPKKTLMSEAELRKVYLESARAEDDKARKTFAEAAFCVAYTLRDADERDARPSSSNGVFKSNELSTPHVVLNKEHIVDVAALASLAVAQKRLPPDACKQVVEATLCRTGAYPIKECYDPHHLFVFYSYSGRPVSAIEVCFTCCRVRIAPGEVDTRTLFGDHESANLEQLAEILTAAGLPLNPYKSLEELRQNLREGEAVHEATDKNSLQPAKSK